MEFSTKRMNTCFPCIIIDLMGCVVNRKLVQLQYIVAQQQQRATHHKSQQQTRLSHAGVPNQEDLEQIMTADTKQEEKP